MAELDGKNVVIVGGTSGLGASAARACVRAGARVVVVGRDAGDAEAIEKELADRVKAIVGDARDGAVSEQAIELAVQTWGRLDALYHVAGGSGRSIGDGPLDQISDEGWDGTLELNLKTIFLSNRAAVRQFLRQVTGGSVLNTGSVLGFSPAPRFFGAHAYAAAKAAIVGFTQSCAAYYAKDSVRFNVIAPALTRTPMSRRSTGDAAIMEYVKTKQPLDGGRVGEPEDLDAAVVFLLSDGSKFVTGQVLSVDGGWCVSEGQIPRS